MEALISFTSPVLLLLQFALLAALVQRYEKRRFWRWFVIYNVAAVLGGFMSVFLFELASPLLYPLQRAYLNWAAKVLSRPPGNTILLIFLRLHMLWYGLLVWYSGAGFAVWIVWRRHISGQRTNEAAPQSQVQ